MFNFLRDIGRMIGHEFMEAQENQLKEMVAEILKIEKIDLDPYNEEHFQDVKQFILNNGKYEFHTIEHPDMETHSIVLEIGTDRFVMGKAIKIEFRKESVGILVSDITPTVDPVVFGKKIRESVGPTPEQEPTNIH